MSGYFRRLLTQSAITSAQLRPVTMHPYAAGTGVPGVSTFDEVIDEGATGDRVSLAQDALDGPPGRSDRKHAHTDHAAGSESNRQAATPARHDRTTQQEQPRDQLARNRRLRTPADAKRSEIESASMAERQPPERAATRSTGLAKISRDTQSVEGATGVSVNRGHADFRLLPEIPAGTARPSITVSPAVRIDGRPGGEAQAKRRAFKDDADASDGVPAVHVTIGRIDVTAHHAAPPTRTRREQPPAMSLDEYLSRRRRGGA